MWLSNTLKILFPLHFCPFSSLFHSMTQNLETRLSKSQSHLMGRKEVFLIRGLSSQPWAPPPPGHRATRLDLPPPPSLPGVALGLSPSHQNVIAGMEATFSPRPWVIMCPLLPPCWLRPHRATTQGGADRAWGQKSPGEGSRFLYGHTLLSSSCCFVWGFLCLSKEQLSPTGK